MKSVIGLGLIVVALVVAGTAFRRAATIGDTLATSHEQLLTMGSVAPELDAQLDESTELVRRVPLLGPRVAREVNTGRAEAAYWQRNYAALAPTAGAAAASPETDPALLLLSANAGFRSTVLQNRTPQTLMRSLDQVLKGYAAVLQADPNAIDAAYNYEYIVRLRTALASNRTATMPAPRQNNMQGEEGEPPMDGQKSDFNVIVPLRPEERQEQMDPGAGADFKRQG